MPSQFRQLAAVVTLWTADHHDHITLVRQFLQRFLAILRRLTDRIHEADVRLGKLSPHRRHQLLNVFKALRRLSHDAEAWPTGERVEVAFLQHDRVGRKVADKTAHLDVALLLDNHGMASLGDESIQGLMLRA